MEAELSHPEPNPGKFGEGTRREKSNTGGAGV